MHASAQLTVYTPQSSTAETSELADGLKAQMHSLNMRQSTSTHHLISDQTGVVHRDLFKSLDTDQSNTIEASELADGLKAQGYNISQQELSQLMGRVDFDRNGTLDIEEFISGLIDWTEVWNFVAPSQPNSRKSTLCALCIQQRLD